jgi:diguanylate cyclase (GGDEF)-like protein
MYLDFRTLFIATAAITLVNAVIFALAWRNAKSLRTIIGYWGLSHVLSGTSMVLLALRGVISDFFSIIIAGACILGSQIATQEGIAQYMEKPGYLRRAAWAVWGLMITSFLFMTYIASSINNRIVVYSVSAAFIALISMKILRVSDDDENAPRRFMMTLLALFTGLMIFRAIFTMIQGQQADLTNPGFVHEWITLGMLCFCTGMSLCLFWLISHRLGLDVHRQALTDTLTGIANRRAMDNRIATLMSLTAECIGFLLIDIDDFKEINDQFGHQAGDRFLIRFGQEISDAVRTSDFVFRYAGDEFVVVMQNCDEVSLMNTAERLRQKIEELTVFWQGHSLRSTISIGLALSNDAVRNGEELMRIADDALYRAKNSGGNSSVLG